MNKLMSFVLIVICLVTLWGCTEAPQSPQEFSTVLTTAPTATSTTKQASTMPIIVTAEQAVKFYEEFMKGERGAIIRVEGRPAVKADFATRDWIDYAYYDMNGDSIPELHVRQDSVYRILTCRDGEVVVWGGASVFAEPLNNGAVLDFRDSLYNISYAYFEYDFFGNEKLRIDFRKAMPNEKGGFDETSDYYFDGKQVSKEEWEVLTEPYFSIGSDKIEWIEYVPQRTP